MCAVSWCVRGPSDPGREEAFRLPAHVCRWVNIYSYAGNVYVDMLWNEVAFRNLAADSVL